MAKIDWTTIGIGALIVGVIYLLAIAQNGINPPICQTNDQCSNNPALKGCILVEGYCSPGELCRVPACLSDGVNYVRHVSSIT